jgi:cell division protein FtsA
VVRSPRFATAMGLLEEARVQRQRGRRAAQQRGGLRDVMQTHEGVVCTSSF